MKSLPCSKLNEPEHGVQEAKAEPMTIDDDHTAVLAANQRFYEAIEARDVAAMHSLWAHGDDVTCVHPGWTILRGWTNVADSWNRILNGPGHNQFILTNTSVRVEGDIAWVVLDENLMTDGHASTIASINVFVRDGDEWLMAAHHGSPVMSG